MRARARGGDRGLGGLGLIRGHERPAAAIAEEDDRVDAGHLAQPLHPRADVDEGVLEDEPALVVAEPRVPPEESQAPLGEERGQVVLGEVDGVVAGDDADAGRRTRRPVPDALARVEARPVDMAGRRVDGDEGALDGRGLRGRVHRARRYSSEPVGPGVGALGRQCLDEVGLGDARALRQRGHEGLPVGATARRPPRRWAARRGARPSTRPGRLAACGPGPRDWARSNRARARATWVQAFGGPGPGRRRWRTRRPARPRGQGQGRRRPARGGRPAAPGPPAPAPGHPSSQPGAASSRNRLTARHRSKTSQSSSSPPRTRASDTG